jgi:hypothetical protein
MSCSKQASQTDSQSDRQTACSPRRDTRAQDVWCSAQTCVRPLPDNTPPPPLSSWQEARRLLALRLPIPAYDHLLKLSHTFNLLDARGAVGVTERATCFATMRSLAREVTGLWLERRAELEYPLGTVPWLAEAEAAARPMPSPAEPATFVLEIGCEELPPDDVVAALEQLRCSHGVGGGGWIGGGMVRRNLLGLVLLPWACWKPGMEGGTEDLTFDVQLGLGLGLGLGFCLQFCTVVPSTMCCRVRLDESTRRRGYHRTLLTPASPQPRP